MRTTYFGSEKIFWACTLRFHLLADVQHVLNEKTNKKYHLNHKKAKSQISPKTIQKTKVKESLKMENKKRRTKHKAVKWYGLWDASISPTHHIAKNTKTSIKISPQHFVSVFMNYTESSFTHHKCLVNCDCNDARTTWKQLQSTFADDREIAINMHLFAYAVTFARCRRCDASLSHFFQLFFIPRNGLKVFSFSFFSSFHFSHAKQCQKLLSLYGVSTVSTPNSASCTPTYSFLLQ